MANYKLGIIADLLKGTFREKIEQCARLGVDGVQLYETGSNFGIRTEVAEKRRILKEFGLSVSALCGDISPFGFTIREQNEKQIAQAKQSLDLALEYHSNIVTAHIGVIPSCPKSSIYRIMQEACNEIGEYAARHNAFFAIETGPEPAKRLQGFIRSLNCGGIAVNFDPANFVMVTGEDIVKAVYLLQDYIVHTHLKDGIMRKQTDPQIIYDYFAEAGIQDIRLEEYFLETPVGEGQVAFDPYFAALHDIGYRGYFTIERENVEDPAADIAHAVAFAREKLQKYM